MDTENKTSKKQWIDPNLIVYGDISSLTQQAIKPKSLGLGDDFASNISEP